MLFRRPCYYDDFICKADKCSDNCCIGWEICIDEDTAELYRSKDGDFGKRLKNCIDFSDETAFILNGERCPFLNDKNLCEIIINMGEESLCQICRDHPRYFEWYGNTKEGGIGLSCEEAARLILTDGCYADYFESDVDDAPDEDFDEESFSLLFSIRERIYDILCDCTLSVESRFCEIISLCQGVQTLLDQSTSLDTDCSFSFENEISRIVPVLEKTEAIDEKWTAEFETLKSTIEKGIDLSYSKEEEKYLERLFAYFVWRYFLKSCFDFRVTEKIRFALFSVTTIFALYKSKNSADLEALLRSAVSYSKQMEYSDENIDVFYESLSD